MKRPPRGKDKGRDKKVKSKFRGGVRAGERSNVLGIERSVARGSSGVGIALRK